MSPANTSAPRTCTTPRRARVLRAHARRGRRRRGRWCPRSGVSSPLTVAQQRGLARAVGAEHRDRFARARRRGRARTAPAPARTRRRARGCASNGPADSSDRCPPPRCGRDQRSGSLANSKHLGIPGRAVEHGLAAAVGGEHVDHRAGEHLGLERRDAALVEDHACGSSPIRGVATAPGHSALMRMPRRSSSPWTLRTRPISDHLVSEYSGFAGQRDDARHRRRDHDRALRLLEQRDRLAQTEEHAVEVHARGTAR